MLDPALAIKHALLSELLQLGTLPDECAGAIAQLPGSFGQASGGSNGSSAAAQEFIHSLGVRVNSRNSRNSAHFRLRSELSSLPGARLSGISPTKPTTRSIPKTANVMLVIDSVLLQPEKYCCGRVYSVLVQLDGMATMSLNTKACAVSCKRFGPVRRDIRHAGARWPAVQYKAESPQGSDRRDPAGVLPSVRPYREHRL